jgi:hypothetical protein
MPKPKRPIDTNQRAKSIVDIATGEDNEQPKDERDPAAVSLGSRGGKARAKNLTPKQRTAIAKNAAKKRWGTNKKDG